ncbi:MAG: class C sortase [Lachnospiraceae bacterium]|nr:class C sortase [Lachnospiraceae bacterium]
MRGRAVRLAAGFLLMAAAVGIFLFPRLSDQISRIRFLEEAYEAVDAADREDYEEAVRYNEKVALLQAERPFAYAGAEAGDRDTEYLSLPAGGSDVICRVEVPTADIYLPVGHGTAEQTLAHEAGHMYGTSIPVGGESVHAVIAAHTGLAGARLFTDLADVHTGDPVLIHLGAETLHYRVDAVNIVRPEEESRYLQIIPGEDYVTLYTCTPIGKNTHRLLVRAKRNSIEETADDAAMEKAGIERKRSRAWLLLVLEGASVLLIPAIFCAVCGIRGILKVFRT